MMGFNRKKSAHELTLDEQNTLFEMDDEVLLFELRRRGRLKTVAASRAEPAFILQHVRADRDAFIDHIRAGIFHGISHELAVNEALFPMKYDKDFVDRIDEKFVGGRDVQFSAELNIVVPKQ